VELPARLGEQPREVTHALEVSHPHRAPLEHQRPIVALATKCADVRGRLLVQPILALDGHRLVRRLRGFDPFEDRAGRLELQDGLVLAAARAEGFGEAYPCERHLIGRADLVPESRSFGKEPLPVRRIALGEPHPSVSKGRAGDQRLALESVGHELQFVGGRAGAVDVAGRDLDLDLRLEERRPLQVGVRWSLPRGHPQGVLERVSYRGRRRGYVSLGQTYQRQTGLGIPAGYMSGQQGLFRAFDVSFSKSDQSELAERPSQLASQVGAEFLARRERLSLCLVARPAQSEDLCAMDPAAPVKAPDGVRLAPPLHRLGPFLGHVVLRESLQRAHELAVNDPCGQRIELPGHRRHPHLVEQRETLPNIAAQDEEPCFCHPSDGARRRVTLRADLDGTPGPLSSAAQVARQHPLVRADYRKPRVRRRLILTLEEPLRSSQPAAHWCHEGGIEKQVHRDANCRPCCRDVVAGLHGSRVSALPRLYGHIEIAGRVGDLAKNR